MISKDEYVKLIKEIRAMLASGAEAECTCQNTKCEWHGDCYNCIRIHRHFGDHIPSCLQFILRDKVKELARATEMAVEPKPSTPDEYRDHVNKVVPPGEGEPA